MSSIRIKSEDVPSTSKKAKGEDTLDLAQIRAELKSEIMKELLSALSPQQSNLGETPMSALAELIRGQSKSFKDLNPVIEGKDYFELRRGEKLVRVKSKQDGTKIFDYLGRISKSDYAKEQLEKARKEGKLVYR